MKIHLESTFYFFIAVRLIVFIDCVVILLCVAFTDGWMNRTSAVLGLIATIVTMMLIGSSIATLFTWDLIKMGLHKRSIFTFTALLLSCLSGALYIAAQSNCDLMTQFGCQSRFPDGAFKAAATFSFLNLLFCIVDVGLSFFFYYLERRKVHHTCDSAVPTVVSEKSFGDVYREYERANQVTSV